MANRWESYKKVGARVGDTVRGHNGYEWVETAVSAWDLGMGSISSGLHNERIHLMDCEVLVDAEDEVIDELTNFDLIQEVGQLESYIAIAKEKGKVSEEFNHCMLEYAIDDFEEALQEAVVPFVSKVTERLHEVYKELNKRGITDVEIH